MWVKVLLIRVALLGSLLVLWEIAPRLGWTDPEVFPPLSLVLRTLVELLQDSRFMGNMLITAQRVVMAFLIATPFSIAVGIYVGARVSLYRAVSPLLQLSLSIPQSILLPVFILALGIGSLQKVVFGITHIVFVVILNAIIAARSVPTGFSLVARSFGATTAETYLKFYLPAMVPYLMTGLRLGLTLDIIGVLLAEMYGSRDGVGIMLFMWGEYPGSAHKLMAGVVLISIFTIAIERILAGLGTKARALAGCFLTSHLSGTSMMQPIIEIKSLGKVYPHPVRPLQALSGISFSVAPGQFVSIVGASGCGKSTLLQIVAGLIEGSEGEVLVDGGLVTGPMPGKIAVVFQDALLLPWRTALANVELPLELKGVDKSLRRKKAEEMVELVGLGGFGDRLPHELSGGMRQRVSIARGLVQDPSIVMMDEPFGALDELTRTRMGDELLRIWEATQKTILLITHSLSEAIYLSDIVYVMGRDPGRILEQVTVDLPRPRNIDMMGSETFGRLRNRLWKLIGSDESAPRGDV